ncbi:hypothetical protein EV701_11191 [Chthoniobacter flavus]|nr:hypothetical protein [Chthoniobacter flavus]TCO90165.1 hypothetical protein EV701_11191 [Chthoniobacter flavus]
MNAPHWHLVLNHLPVMGLLFVVLLLGYALVSGRGELYGVCLGALVLLGLVTIAVFYTGHGADEALMMDLSAADEKFVDAHAKAAKTAFICMCILGGIALVVAWLGRKLPHISRGVAAIILVLSLAELVLMGRTANLGGNIRHPEIRPAQPETAAPSATKEEAK